MSTDKNYKKILEDNKIKILQIKNVPDCSGIYILTRVDENRIHYSYVGQSVHMLTRLAEHLSGYQHIDLSIKKHGLYGITNLNGWNIDFVICRKEELDDKEQYYIMEYLKKGYQSRNKTLGSQGVGKTSIDDHGAEGYYKGVEAGIKRSKNYIKELFTKYFNVSFKDAKRLKINERKLNEFYNWMEDENGNNTTSK